MQSLEGVKLGAVLVQDALSLSWIEARIDDTR